MDIRFSELSTVMNGKDPVDGVQTSTVWINVGVFLF